jgi:hypothetical protein
MPASPSKLSNELPQPTYTPAIVGLGIMLIAFGIVSTWAVAVLGALLVAVGLTGWYAEIRREH